MNTQTISDALKEQIGLAQVRAAVFTTYTLDTAFFEQDVVPLLLPGSGGYSVDPELRLPVVRERLQTSGLLIDVYADEKVFWSNDLPRSPSMDYGCFPVPPGNGAFHGKVILLLLRQPDGSEQLRVAAGSCNLTRSGWWDNIECQHWESVDSKSVPSGFLAALREDVEYLGALREEQLPKGESDTALGRLKFFLDRCVADVDASPVHYFGLAHRRSGSTSFPEFLRQGTAQLNIGRCEAVEVISPFFADDVANRLHRELVADTCPTRLLMPLDDEGKALCKPDYIAHIQQEDGVEWSEWKSEWKAALGVGGEPYRSLHAKTFQVLGEEASAVFFGSVNFTRKALYENVEAGFLVRYPRRKPFLDALEPEQVLEPSERMLETSPGDEADNASDTYPFAISFHFDWLTETFDAISPATEPFEIDLIGSEGETHPLISGWPVGGPDNRGEQIYRLPSDRDISRLKEHLKRSAIVTVQIRIAAKDRSDPASSQLALIQQSHWSHKPPAQPVSLSDAQILAVYAGMSAEDREIMINNARVHTLMLKGLISVEDVVDVEPIQTQFFARYAEIFHAFRSLGRRLADSEGERVDYYLTGAGPDSIPNLIEVAMNPAEVLADGGKVDWVSAYLILLSALELFRHANFAARPMVPEKTAEIEERLKEAKAALRLPEGQNRKQFFNWFEGQFFKDYHAVESGA